MKPSMYSLSSNVSKPGLCRNRTSEIWTLRSFYTSENNQKNPAHAKMTLRAEGMRERLREMLRQ